MKVILRALTHPEIGDIAIDDSLFVIGRQEAPFNAHNGDAVAKLSRRHARIFEQDSHFFLADAGSLNGTQLNGKRLGAQAARLRQGDEISFADQLKFRVELPDQAAPASIESEVQLSLIPVDASSGLDTLVISRFPFLISQTEGAFARYRNGHGEALRHLSRRHAHIFLNHGQPHIEDLGSTNGTLVADKRLDEHPVPLQSGDELTFGCPTFRYRVKLAAVEQPPVAGETVAGKVNTESSTAEPKTTFITSASPFLDIFCQQQEPAREEAESDAAEPTPPTTGPTGRLGRMGYFISEFKRALGVGENPASLTRRLIGAAVVVLLAGGALLLYQRGAEERALKTLLAEARYPEAEQRAGRYLQQHPENLEIRVLASEALLKARVPDWQSQLDQQAFNEARQQLGAGEAVHPQGRQLLTLLDWITDLEQFFSQRAAGSTLQLYRDEQQIHSLLADWQALGNDGRQMMDLIRDQIPAFGPLHTRVFSHLRQLEYESSAYLAAIDSLNSDLQTLLAANRADEVTGLLDDFRKQYPNIQGLEQLTQDLEDYLVLQQSIGRRDLDVVADPEPLLAFRTPPFLQVSEQLRAELPPAAIIERHREAQRAWLSGNTQQAISLLEAQISQPWGDALEPQLQHYRSVATGYSQLQNNSEATDTGPALIAFYSALDPGQDGYFLDILRPDFQRHADEARRNAEAALLAAEQYWEQYQQQGGIGSSLRLEAEISERFREQARLLSRAQDQASQGIRLYGLLDQTPAEPSLSLQQRIATEVEGQRQWLQDLSTVLDPPLLDAKLRLLAPPEETSP